MHDINTGNLLSLSAKATADQELDMQHGPIAIIGAACRFPGAPSLSAFWNLLATGQQAIREIGEDRWSTRFYGHPRLAEPGKSYSWAAGTLDNIDSFDAAFFGISTREAEQMDPQQRLLLELAWETIEDAGIPAGKLKGEPVGVYVAASGTEYLNLRFGDPSSADPYFMTGNTLSIFSNRISYVLDLHGPSLTIDTACSSSLVALHVACEDIRHGRVPMALVGGVNLLLSPYPFIGFSQARMLSKSGRCFSFDARADGYVRGEGGGAVLLKPLAHALADGNHVRGVILASGTNSDGRTIGLSLPNKASQQALLTSIYGEAGIDPEDLVFVEAHGTGTAAGDPIETGAIGEALGRGRSSPLLIGSVKTNVGHLEAASGFAGLLKAILALEHGVLPRSLNYENPNPAIDFAGLNLKVADEPVEFGRDGPPKIAGVSSFGFGGTNAHLIVGAAPLSYRPIDNQEVVLPLLLSARSESALHDLSALWLDRLVDLDAGARTKLARAAMQGRDHHPHRLAVLDDPCVGLAAFRAGQKSDNVVTGAARSNSSAIAFVFSGNGAQWIGMGQDARASSPTFDAALIDIDTVLSKYLGWSVIDVLDDSSTEIARTDIAQPLLFVIQVAIVQVLRGLGIEAQAVMGHSVGEIAAAWAAGALTLDDAARLVVVRSRHQHLTAGFGRMAVVRATPEEILEAAAVVNAAIEIAAYNTSKSLTIAGQLDDLMLVAKEARRRSLPFTMLDLDYAFHSTVMNGIQEGLINDLVHLTPQTGKISFISAVDGKPMDGTALGPNYWWRNIREPVHFADATRSLVESGIEIFLEIGPSPVLQSYMRDLLIEEDRSGHVLPTLVKTPAKVDPFWRIAASCYVAGYPWWTAPIFAGSIEARDLPSYPWQRKRHWIPFTTEALDLVNPSSSHWLLGFRWRRDAAEWFSHVDTTTHRWLTDHQVGESIVLPAAAIIDGALAAARIQQGNAPLLELRDVEVRRPVLLGEEQLRELRFRLESQGQFSLSGRSRFTDDAWTVHASGKIEHVDLAAAPLTAPPTKKERSTGACIGKEAVYLAAARLGLHYGPEFQVIENVTCFSEDEAWVEFRAVDQIAGSVIDPRLLDGALQGLLGLLSARLVNDDNHLVMLPWRFDRVRLSNTASTQPIGAHLHIRSATERAVVADLLLLDADQNPVLSIDGCWLQPVQISRRRSIEQNIFHFVQTPSPLKGLSLRIKPPPNNIVRYDLGSTDFALLGEAFIASRAFTALAKRTEFDQEFSVETMVALGSVAKGSEPLLTSLLNLLLRYDAVNQNGDYWMLKASADLPDASEIWRSLFYDTPGLPAVTSLLAWADEHLDTSLRHGDAAQEEPPSALREQLFFGGQIRDRLCQAIMDATTAIIDNVPRFRTWRILDLDAGGGLVARRLLPHLHQLSISYEYVLAVEPDSVAQGKEAIDAWPNAQVRLWPFDKAATDQDFESFDIIVAGQWLSKRQRDYSVVEQLRSLLTPGGTFLALEPEPNAILDFILGLKTEWWHGRSTSTGALKSSDGWMAQLSEAGFDDVNSHRVAEEPWPLVLITCSTPEARLQPAVRERTIIIVCKQDDSLATTLRKTLNKQDISSIYVPIAALGTTLAETPDALVILLPSLSKSDEADRIMAVAKVATLVNSFDAELLIVTRDIAALTGIGRVAANEMPELRCRRIELAHNLTDVAAAEALVEELRGGGGSEREVSWTDDGRFVPRLRRGLLPSREAIRSFKLVQEEPGFLDSLRWEQVELLRPDRGEVVIEVQAAGLNFRDVMWAMALLPGEALLDGFAGQSLGMECAGIIAAVGAGVKDLNIGDRVMAFAPAAFSSHARTLAACVTRIPDELDFAAAATMPVAFITVLYALETLGRLQSGETILIHGGAGGVGLAAIQYALHKGAIVIATAGSSAKRAMLRLIGVAHVLDSRSLLFADEVMQLTNGKGVDVVLNSLSGDAMEKSLGLMAPFGRFLELGKRDFYQSTRVSIRPFRHNVSYFAIDADELVGRQPGVTAAVMTRLRTLLTTGVLRPLPYVKYGFGEVVDAFRLMRSSGHIGKIVLTTEPITARPRRSSDRMLLSADKTLIVTGGISGFGLATARWFVQSGVRHIALISRRGTATPGCEDALQSLQQAGVETLKCYACDVADEALLSATLDTIRHEMPPIGAVVHAAMVVEDNLLSGLDRDEVERVLQPKLGGADALDRLTRQDPIELFLLFSSATTLLGAPGQASYVAANMALEALARQRHNEGLPALAVGWGPIANAGYLADRPAARDALARRLGAIPITAENALASLPTLLRSGLPVIAFAEVDWTLAKGRLPILAEPIFSGISAQSSLSETNEMTVSFVGKTPDEARDIVQTVLVEEIAGILRVARTDLDPNRPLTEVGMDSLMAVELKLGVERRLRIEFPALALNDSVTIATMAKRLAARLDETPETDAALDVLLQHESRSESADALAKSVTEARELEKLRS